MARKPRLHFPGAIYHVVLNGNGNCQVFSDDTDRTRLLLLLQEGIEKFGHKIHGYCLVPTAVHLVIEVDQVPLSRIMQQLGFRYTRWFNNWHGEIGHLFQGRYRAILIDPEKYLLDLVCHLHYLPVALDLTDDPMQFSWSSHRAYCMREQVPWLTTERTLLQIDQTGTRALLKFHARVNDAGKTPEIDFLRGGGYDPRVLGDDDFVRGALKLSRQKYQPRLNPDKVFAVVEQSFKLSEQELAAPGKARQAAEARAFIAWLYLHTGCATLTNLGERLNRDISTLSSSIRRLDLKAKKDQQLAERMQLLLKRVRR